MQGRRMSFERFKMRDGRVIVIDTMEGQIQLDAFRDFLGSGLQIQLEVRPHTVGYLEIISILGSKS